ncbi:nucleotidyltransferase domain-containing protein [Amycolatopsis sp. FBCC-B4732]|uniref:nucleotidyltransferase domain-containing protein n=1 Tax=Amycolatopsis sp. FBCC-B4732 TaxID=3079339 RepID=UPI00248D36C7|nr:nucleotidyltransferase domain-containing protein [Amycolatopsis sp. FBCC-B4732]
MDGESRSTRPGSAGNDTFFLARRAARELADRPGVIGAFVVGGIAQGLHTPNSDIDIHLVGGDSPAPRTQFGIGRTRVDVHQVPLTRLAALVDAVTAADVADALAPTVPTADLELLARVSQADVVVASDALRALLDRLATSAPAVRRQLLRHWLTTAHLWWEDHDGFLRIGEQDGALDAARRSLVAAGKAVLVARGDLHPAPKWVWRQLDRSAPRGFPTELFRALGRADLASARDGVTTADLEQLLQTCLLAAATVGWHGGALADWTHWQRGSGALARAAGWHPRAAVTGVVAALAGRRRVALRPDAALVWALSGGVTDEELAERIRAVGAELPVYANLTAARREVVVARLLASGLLVRDRG